MFTHKAFFSFSIGILILLTFTHANPIQITQSDILGLGKLQGIIYHPNGEFLISYGGRGIVLWNTSNYKPFRILDSPPLYKAFLSPDGQKLITGSQNPYGDRVLLLDIKIGSHETLIQSDYGSSLLGVNPKGGLIALKDETIEFWNIEKKELEDILPYNYNDYIISAAISPDGLTLATGSRGKAYTPSYSEDKVIRLWNISQKELRLSMQGHIEPIRSLAFSPDSQTLASASSDKTIKLWDVNTGELKASLEGYEILWRSLIFSPDGKTLVSGGDGASFNPITLNLMWGLGGDIFLWDVSKGKVKSILQRDQGAWIQSLSFHPNGKKLAVEASDFIQVWNVESGKLEKVLEGHDFDTRTLAISADGQTIISGMGDNNIGIVDVKTQKRLAVLQGHDHFLYTLNLSPDGSKFASSSRDGIVKLWDLVEKKLITTFEGHTNDVLDIAFSSDGFSLASASSDGTIKLWNVANGKLETTLLGYSDVAYLVSFSSNGQTLASAGRDSQGNNTIKLWNVASGKLENTLQEHGRGFGSIEFSPDGSALAFSSGPERNIKLWDTKTLEIIKTIPASKNVKELLFFPDGLTLASGSSGDTTIKLWNVKSGELEAVLEGHNGSISALALSADGSLLTSKATDGTIRFWDVGQWGNLP